MIRAVNVGEISDIARVAHEANRAYCKTLGDDSQLPWVDAPLWQRQSAFGGVDAIVSGEITEPEGAHKSWMARKIADGWGYGKEKDPGLKTHPCLIPFGELSDEQQRKDYLFFAVVQALLTAEDQGRNYIIFRCDIDKSTVVSVLDKSRGEDVYVGVAECPDIRTAGIVKDALEHRESEEVTL